MINLPNFTFHFSNTGLIRAAKKQGVNIKHIFVDTVGKADKYQTYLKSIFPEYDITVAVKADSTYPIVSAASICAKVARDHALQVWDFQEGMEFTHEDFGSGYAGGNAHTLNINLYRLQCKPTIPGEASPLLKT